MDQEKYIPIKELVQQLQEGVSDIESGSLSNDDIIALQKKGRELYERLTVLRFKAFELFSSREEETNELSPESQINLIDAIAEVKTESLVEKHQSSPLSSVGEGLTILERANFTSVLFSDDGNKFNDMLDAVDQSESAKEAEKIFKKSINPVGSVEDIDLAYSTFEKRIPRLFHQ